MKFLIENYGKTTNKPIYHISLNAFVHDKYFSGSAGKRGYIISIT
jgi:hypothetical protein